MATLFQKSRGFIFAQTAYVHLLTRLSANKPRNEALSVIDLGTEVCVVTIECRLQSVRRHQRVHQPLHQARTQWLDRPGELLYATVLLARAYWTSAIATRLLQAGREGSSGVGI